MHLHPAELREGAASGARIAERYLKVAGAFQAPVHIEGTARRGATFAFLR
jgi:hypothetical protein